jgi:hypothetical protein
MPAVVVVAAWAAVAAAVTTAGARAAEGPDCPVLDLPAAAQHEPHVSDEVEVLDWVIRDTSPRRSGSQHIMMNVYLGRLTADGRVRYTATSLPLPLACMQHWVPRESLARFVRNRPGMGGFHRDDWMVEVRLAAREGTVGIAFEMSYVRLSEWPAEARPRALQRAGARGKTRGKTERMTGLEN